MKQSFQIFDRVFGLWSNSDSYYPGYISGVKYIALALGGYDVRYDIEFDDVDSELSIEEERILLDTTTIPIGEVVKVKYALLEAPYLPKLGLKKENENLNSEIKKIKERCNVKATVINVHEDGTGEISYTVEYLDQSSIGEMFLKFAKRRKIKDQIELKQEHKISRNRISQFLFKKDKKEVNEYIRANTRKRSREYQSNINNDEEEDEINIFYSSKSSSSSTTGAIRAKKNIYDDDDEADGYNDSDVESKWAQTNERSIENDFLHSLYDVSSTPRYNDIIKWSPSGHTVLITDLESFRSKILPRQFPKCKNQQSFFKQLSNYKFTQNVLGDGTIVEISHINFLKGKRADITIIYDDERNAYLAMQESKRRNMKMQQEKEKKRTQQQQQHEEDIISQPPPEISLEQLRQEEASWMRKFEETQSMVQVVKERMVKLSREIDRLKNMPHRQAQDLLSFQRRTRDMEAINKELDKKIEAHIKLYGDVQQDYSHVISESDYNASVYGEKRNIYQEMNTSSNSRHQYSEMDDLYQQHQHRNIMQLAPPSRPISTISTQKPTKFFMDDIDGEPIE